MLHYIVVIISTLALLIAYHGTSKVSTFSLGLDVFCAVVTGYNAIAYGLSSEWLPMICFGIAAFNWVLCLIFETRRNKKLANIISQEDSKEE